MGSKFWGIAQSARLAVGYPLPPLRGSVHARKAATGLSMVSRFARAAACGLPRGSGRRRLFTRCCCLVSAGPTVARAPSLLLFRSRIGPVRSHKAPSLAAMPCRAQRIRQLRLSHSQAACPLFAHAQCGIHAALHLTGEFPRLAWFWRKLHMAGSRVDAAVEFFTRHAQVLKKHCHDILWAFLLRLLS